MQRYTRAIQQNLIRNVSECRPFFSPPLLLRLLIIHGATIARLQLRVPEISVSFGADISHHQNSFSENGSDSETIRTETKEHPETARTQMPKTFFSANPMVSCEQILSIFVTHFVGIVDTTTTTTAAAISQNRQRRIVECLSTHNLASSVKCFCPCLWMCVWNEL